MSPALCIVLVLLSIMDFSSCTTPTAKSHTTYENDIYSTLALKSRAIISNGGLAAIGEGDAPTKIASIDLAKYNARIELSRLVNTKVVAYQKSFTNSNTEPDGFTSLSVATSKALLERAHFIETRVDILDGSYHTYTLIVVESDQVQSLVNHSP